MDIVKELVNNLIIIVVLAVFLEMLLPFGDMKNYVALIMGMLVIIVVLETVSIILRPDFTLGIPKVFTKASQEDFNALTQYKKGVEQQVSSIVGLSGAYEVLNVEVKFNEDPGDENFGKITAIEVTVSPVKDTKSCSGGIEPVEVHLDSKTSLLEHNMQQNETAKSLTESLSSFYGLNCQKVKINYK